jgi:hypothetical protein
MIEAHEHLNPGQQPRTRRQAPANTIENTFNRKVMVLSEPGHGSPRQAAAVLDELDRLRRATRRSARAPWYPLVYFGLVTTISAPVVAVAGVSSLAPLWVVAGVAGLLLMRRYQERRSRARGLTGRRLGAWAIGLTMFVGAVAAGVAVGRTTGPDGGVLAPIVVVVVGYLALGCLRRDPLPSLALAPGAGLAAAFALAGLDPWLVELTFGVGMTAAGLGLRRAVVSS